MMRSFNVYGIWPQANKHTHTFCNTVPLVWGSLRLAPIMPNVNFSGKESPQRSAGSQNLGPCEYQSDSPTTELLGSWRSSRSSLVTWLSDFSCQVHCLQFANGYPQLWKGLWAWGKLAVQAHCLIMSRLTHYPHPQPLVLQTTPFTKGVVCEIILSLQLYLPTHVQTLTLTQVIVIAQCQGFMAVNRGV